LFPALVDSLKSSADFKDGLAGVKVGSKSGFIIGCTKVLAKIANRIAKKSNIGVFTQPETVLDRIAVDDIWGSS